MLHECLRAFMLSNYTRSPTPPPTTELSAILPHCQLQRMVLNFENATWRAAHVVFPTVGVEGGAPSILHRQKVIRVQTGLKIKCDSVSGIIVTPWHFKLV